MLNKILCPLKFMLFIDPPLACDVWLFVRLLLWGMCSLSALPILAYLLR